MTAILAVLAVGGVHVPLAPDLPDVRREFLLSDSGAALVLTEEALRDRFGGDIPVRALDAEWAGTGPAAPPAAFPTRPARTRRPASCTPPAPPAPPRAWW